MYRLRTATGAQTVPEPPALDHTDGPDPRPRERDGQSALERLAVARIAQDVAAMPASDVVQLVLWPATIARWAREHDVSAAVAYNMLARFKPYRRVRELLAHRLDVPGFVLDHLIDAARPLPAAQRASADVERAVPPPAAPAPIPPTVRLPAVRDGSNPIERRAVWQVAHQIAALPASVLVQVVLFPETLAGWARARGSPAAMVYAMLAGGQPHPGLREALARRLGVSQSALALLLDAQRREPAHPSPIVEPPSPRPLPPDDRAPSADGPAAASTPTADAENQLSLGF